MKEIKFYIPSSLNTTEIEIKTLIAGGLYERNKITLNEASGILKTSKEETVRLFQLYGFSIEKSNGDDFISDRENV